MIARGLKTRRRDGGAPKRPRNALRGQGRAEGGAGFDGAGVQGGGLRERRRCYRKRPIGCHRSSPERAQRSLPVSLPSLMSVRISSTDSGP